MIKNTFYLLILGLLIYSAFQFAIPYYRYYAFRSDVKETLETSVSVETRPEEVKERIMSLANQYKIPLKEKNITLKKNGKYVFRASWKETVNLYEKNYEFFINIEEW
ncbi:MAG: hypothetical protein HY752_01250 [Nitrospirae bacterium]|nr:hypothetical protein [Nitrospirota bacterium]